MVTGLARRGRTVPPGVRMDGASHQFIIYTRRPPGTHKELDAVMTRFLGPWPSVWMTTSWLGLLGSPLPASP